MGHGEGLGASGEGQRLGQSGGEPREGTWWGTQRRRAQGRGTRGHGGTHRRAQGRGRGGAWQREARGRGQRWGAHRGEWREGGRGGPAEGSHLALLCGTAIPKPPPSPHCCSPVVLKPGSGLGGGVCWGVPHAGTLRSPSGHVHVPKCPPASPRAHLPAPQGVGEHVWVRATRIPPPRAKPGRAPISHQPLPWASSGHGDSKQPLSASVSPLAKQTHLPPLVPWGAFLPPQSCPHKVFTSPFCPGCSPGGGPGPVGGRPPGAGWMPGVWGAAGLGSMSCTSRG